MILCVLLQLCCMCLYVTECGETIRSTSDDDGVVHSGYITSPNYPGRYGPHLRCLYYLIARPNQRVKLAFIDFDVSGVLPR